MKIIQSPSPNFSKSNYKIEGVQIHKTLGVNSLSWLLNPKSQSSAHYLIGRDGEIHQLVQHNKRPWAAGRINNPSERAKAIMKKYPWGTYVKPGHYLLQIEMEALERESFTDQQYLSLVYIIENKLGFKLKPEYLLEHRDTASDKPKLSYERANLIELLKGDEELMVLEEGEKITLEVKDGRVIIKK